MHEQELKKLRDNTSPTFCMAKFHEATIWLYSSFIASCHHTPFSYTGETVLNFYNNDFKRAAQDKMLNGERPSDCNYCWKLEERKVTSDREYKSLAYNSHLPYENYSDRRFNFKPRVLELAFQNTCNLACAYCSPSFSTEWINDIKKNGIYLGILTDKKEHYSRGIDKVKPVDMNLFWEWFEGVAPELESLRITGGEPLLHEDTFKTFEKMLTFNPNVEFVIHTNLCQKPTVINRFINSVNKFPRVRINVSNESAGSVAEFIRDGMIYSEWLGNVEKLVTETKADVSISTTITAMSLISLDELFDDIIKIRTKNNITNPYISINFATYPEFQSLDCLKKKERIFYQEKFNQYYKNKQINLLDKEKLVFPRLLTALNPNNTHINQKMLRFDSDTFFKQYIDRRNKDKSILKLLGRK